MFLFQRVATLKGKPRETMAWAVEVTEYVNRTKDHDRPTTVWQSLFGAPMGTVTWSTLVESRAQMGATMMQLMGEDGYHERIEQALEFDSGLPVEDTLRRFVSGDPEDRMPDVGGICEIVSGTAAPGRIADVMAWGPEIAGKVARLTGRMPSFWADAYGDVGRVTWFTLAPDLATVDEGQAALASSDDYLAEVAKGTDLFIAGSGTRAMAMRLG